MQHSASHRFLLKVASFRSRGRRSAGLAHPTRQAPTMTVSRPGVRYVVPDRGVPTNVAIVPPPAGEASASSTLQGLLLARPSWSSLPLRVEPCELERGA